jgi:hypothetical protein
MDDISEMTGVRIGVKRTSKGVGELCKAPKEELMAWYRIYEPAEHLFIG